MVTFVTLFLGLILGSSDVTVAVGPGVARVEVRLDGAPVAALTAPDWCASVDFGQELIPGELVAIAYDAKGRELSRARQPINRPRPDAEATFVLERGPRGKGTVARLSWHNIAFETPTSVQVTFDGSPLPVADPRQFTLPDHAPEQLHLLRAELQFPESIEAVAELPFGGLYKDEALSELTSVVVQLGTRKKLPEAAKLSGWFQGEGQTLRPVAVEEGPAEVVFVLDESALAPLQTMSAPSMRPRTTAAFGKDQRFRFLWAVPTRREHSGFQHDLFPRSEDITSRDGGFFRAADRVTRARVSGLPQRLADAVAVAGLSAVRRERRRAVVLLLGPEPVDESRKSVEVVLRYLSRISVPFEVWCLHPGAASKAERWGGCEDASNERRLTRAVSKLSDALERQRIVWLAGVHRPELVVLGPQASGIALAR